MFGGSNILEYVYGSNHIHVTLGGVDMADNFYYLGYENRYQKVYEAGVERWGHSPDDEILLAALTRWVNIHQLVDKKVIEFACGEGAGGVILSKLGSIYQGVDIAPSAVGKTRKVLKPFPHASVSLLDMVNQPIAEKYDAALDVMGFHMLLIDSDRRKYLNNAFHCLRRGAPMLFFREAYRMDAPSGSIKTLEEWQALTDDDYVTPQKRIVKQNGMHIEVSIPLLPSRARTKQGYIKEMHEVGFIIDEFIEMDINERCPYSASIFVHKP